MNPELHEERLFKLLHALEMSITKLTDQLKKASMNVIAGQVAGAFLGDARYQSLTDDDVATRASDIARNAMEKLK